MKNSMYPHGKDYAGFEWDGQIALTRTGTRVSFDRMGEPDESRHTMPMWLVRCGRCGFRRSMAAQNIHRESKAGRSRCPNCNHKKVSFVIPKALFQWEDIPRWNRHRVARIEPFANERKCAFSLPRTFENKRVRQ